MSTTTTPAPVTPPPRLGATPHVEEPERSSDPRWSIALRWLGDATSILLLIAVLWWLAYHDGGREPGPLAKVGLVGAIAVPAAAAELRRVPRSVAALVLLWTVGLVTSIAFAADRSGFALTTVTYSLPVVVGLSAYRIWRRDWGPPAIGGLLLVSFGLYWYRAFMDWWGLALFEGRQPEWRPLSWHNQSGTLMAAFGLLFGGLALTGRKVVAFVFGLATAGAVAGAWLSGSRGTLVVLALGIIVLTLVSLRTRGWLSTAWRTTALALVSVSIVLGLVGFARMEASPGTEVAQPVSARTESAEANFFRRFLQMDAAIGMFVDRPMTGQGLGSYPHISIAFMSPESNLTVSAHNEYAEVMGEGGLLLAFPFAGLTLVALVVGVRRWRTAGRGFSELGDEIEPGDIRWPLSLGAIAAVAALIAHQAGDLDWAYVVIPSLLAMGVAIVGADVGAPHADRSNSTRPWPLAAVVAVLLSVLLAVGSIAVFWQNRSHGLQPDLSAEELAHVPVAWEPDRASNVAFQLLRAGELDEARWTLSRAAAWNPGYHPVHVDLAIVDYMAGDISGRELVDVLLDGYLDFASTNEVGQALIEGGDYALARSVLESLLEVYPAYETWGVDVNRGDTWYLLVRTAAEEGGCETARTEASLARQAEGMGPDELEPIDELVTSTCQ